VTIATVMRQCVFCGAQREFEQPPCDEHGADCLELACVVCGLALLDGDGCAGATPKAVDLPRTA
jgi:hypothetical protein